MADKNEITEDDLNDESVLGMVQGKLEGLNIAKTILETCIMALYLERKDKESDALRSALDFLKLDIDKAEKEASFLGKEWREKRGIKY